MHIPYYGIMLSVTYTQNGLRYIRYNDVLPFFFLLI